MPLAADYPLLEVFWIIALVSLWAVWIFTVIWTLADNFGRHDHGGVAKAVWTVVIILFPLLGVLTVFNVTKEALVARQAITEPQPRPVAGEPRVAVKPKQPVEPEWRVDARIPVDDVLAL